MNHEEIIVKIVRNFANNTGKTSHPEVFLVKGVLKYAANLQENALADV